MARVCKKTYAERSLTCQTVDFHWLLSSSICCVLSRVQGEVLACRLTFIFVFLRSDWVPTGASQSWWTCLGGTGGGATHLRVVISLIFHGVRLKIWKNLARTDTRKRGDRSSCSLGSELLILLIRLFVVIVGSIMLMITVKLAVQLSNCLKGLCN
jgi:hypothetical protein